MPIHDFICSECNFKTEVYQVLKRGYDLPATHSCPKCQGIMKKVFSKPAGLSLFREGYYELDDPGYDPYITSKTQLKEECRKRNLVSRYLQDSGTSIRR